MLEQDGTDCIEVVIAPLLYVKLNIATRCSAMAMQENGREFQ